MAFDQESYYARNRWGSIHLPPFKVNLMNAIWRDVPGYEGAYQVSDAGEFRSVTRILPDGRKFTGRVLNPSPKTSNRGQIYISFGAWNGVGEKRIAASRIVLSAFIGERPQGMEAIHVDGNVTNNRLSNLKWGNRSAQVLGRALYCKDVKGERNGQSKLSDEQVRDIHSRYAAGEKQKNLAKEYCISIGYINGIVNGRFRKESSNKGN